MHALVFRQLAAKIFKLPNNPLACISDTLSLEVTEVWHHDCGQLLRSLKLTCNVPDSKDADFAHKRRMFVMCFNIFREDVFAGRQFDHVFPAADYVEVALLAEPAHVA